ncbi:glutaredoxin domain-containing protein [Mycobacterium neglectum]|uniref:glutaredoxin domain-containing protein n=1 Tax=Mycobacterium neglectum TaxID=242737 RepID=UPI000BFEEC93|nr:glutaredoxin domain-containing protein [Mycobacterium neglectum]
MSVELYWMPGCSSCLRMKEFVEQSGIGYVAINVDTEPERAAKLTSQGLRVPAACVGDKCVNGVNLASVASLIGVDYSPPEMLSPAELMVRYRRVIQALCDLIDQIPPEHAGFTLPGRDRDIVTLAGHAGCVMRYFLGKYDDDDFDGFFDDLEPGHRDAPRLVEFARETFHRTEVWWHDDGHDDPLDRVAPLYWGSRTLAEGFEREVWHTAQHTRQLAYMLEQIGVNPRGALTPEDLAGLPLPNRIFD